jgi:hypothetical protein
MPGGGATGIDEASTGHRVQRQGAARCSLPRRPLTWVMNRIDAGANIANSVTAHGAGAVLRDSFVSDNESRGCALHRGVQGQGVTS